MVYPRVRGWKGRKQNRTLNIDWYSPRAGVRKIFSELGRGTMSCLLERSFRESVRIAILRNEIRTSFPEPPEENPLPEDLIERSFAIEVQKARRLSAEIKKNQFSKKEEEHRGGPPFFWIVGGINGAGKTTLCRSANVKALFGTVQVMNADRLARDRRMLEPEISQYDADRWAADTVYAVAARRIGERKSVSLETVLSTDKYKPLVERALENGYRIGFVYVTLGSPEQSIERVALRVLNDGHDVPEEKIRARWSKSHENWNWFAERAHFGIVFDNGGSIPSKTILVRDGQILFSGEISEEWENRISRFPKSPDFRILEDDPRWEPGF